MIDLTLEGPWGIGLVMFVLGIFFIIIWRIDIENFIRYWTKKKNGEPTGIKNPKATNILILIFGICIIAFGLFLFGISIKYLNPPTNSPEPSPSDTPSSTLISTFPPTPTSTATVTPTSTTTPTPTITPTVTPTITPTFPAEEFINFCIPDTWQIVPETIMSLNNLEEVECKLNYARFGFFPHDPGLGINLSSETSTYLIGLVRNLPTGDWTLEIRLTAKIYHLQSSNEIDNFNNVFTINFLGSNYSGEVNMEQLVSFIDTSNEKYTNLRIFGTHESYFESINPLLINCVKKDLNVTCSVIGTSSNSSSNDTITKTITLTGDSTWTTLFLGYDLRPGSVVDINISSFNITPH